MENKLQKFFLAAGAILFAGSIGYLCFQYSDISTLAAAVSDEYGFIPVMIKMKQSLLGHDVKGTFSYAFFNYGFLYFLVNTLLSWGFVGDSSSVGQVVIPRLVSAAAAVGTMIVVYRMARITMDKMSALGVVGLLLSAPAIWMIGTWFHPDFPMTLFVLIGMLALLRDDFKFGRSYWVASVMIGVAIGIKFQAVTFLPVFFLYGLAHLGSDNPRPGRWHQPVLMSLGAVGLAGLVFVAMNPYLLHPQGLRAFIRFFEGNLVSMASNHGVVGVIPFHRRLDWCLFRPYLSGLVSLILATLAAVAVIRHFKSPGLRRYWVVGLSGLFVLVYSLVTINKMEAHYYLAAVIVTVAGLSPILNLGSARRGLWVLSGLIGLNIGAHRPEFESLIHRPQYTAYVMHWAESRREIAIKLSEILGPNDYLLASPKVLIELNHIPIPMSHVIRIGGPIELRMIEPKSQLRYFNDLHIPPQPFIPMKAVIIDKSDPYFDSRQLDHLVDRVGYEEGARLITSLRSGFLGYSVAYEDGNVVIFVQRTPQ